MKYLCKLSVPAIIVFLAWYATGTVMAQSENWTHFRGSELNGISGSAHPPVTWNDTAHVSWKTNLEGKGWSSPVVWDDQIWLTTAAADGSRMSTVCLDWQTGAILHDIPLFTPGHIESKHAINSYATPTPCIEEGAVYVHFGTYGTACLQISDGKVVWQRTDLNCTHVQGPGSSPVLYKNLLILHLEGNDVQYLVALNKKTGETVWQTHRPEAVYEPLAPIGKKAYITPLIVNVNGMDLLISNGSAVCIAYDPETGKEVWRVVQGIDSTIAMPVSEKGMVYFFPGFVNSPDGGNHTELLAVNPDGKGDITATHVVWRHESPSLQLLTPVIRNGLIYMVDTRNTLLCLDALTGAEVWSRKVIAKYNASPVIAAGMIYFTSVRGETLILREGRQLEVIAENKLPGEVFATPAILRNAILIRTDKALYCIRQQ
jgi:outer membrane protein assembly factor BamB